VANFDSFVPAFRQDGPVSDSSAVPSSQAAADRETRLRALLDLLREGGEATLRQLAERLVDLPEDQSFGQVEYDLRDIVLQLAARSHQTALHVSKKKAT
jgi:hypothetical protein